MDTGNKYLMGLDTYLIEPTGKIIARTGDVSYVFRLIMQDPSRRSKPLEEIRQWQPTSYTHQKLAWRYEPFVYKDSYGYIRHTTSHLLCGPWNPSPIPSTPDLMNALLGEIRGDVANLANMLGEYKQAAETVSSLGHHLLYSIRAAKRGNMVQAWKFLKRALSGSDSTRPLAQLSGGWLQYRFAIQTVVDDIDKSVLELRARLPVPLTGRVTKRVRISSEFSKTLASEVSAAVRIDGYKKLTAIYEVDNTLLKSMLDHGMTNPMSLVWELTHLSWVVDYVVGIAEWLSALDVPLILTKSACWETIKVANFEKMSSFGKAGLGNNSTVYLHGSARLNSVRASRTVRPLLPVLPVWKPHFTAIRLTNLIALGLSMSSGTYQKRT